LLCLNSLVVPNVKNVESKSIIEIGQDLQRLKEAGQKSAIGVTDMSGGTITLSNIGNIGGTVLHPVLVSSEVCIGAVGRIQKLPRYAMIKDADSNKKEVVVPEQIMQCSWNADHRVVDGATMARFVALWKQYLENPTLMMCHLS
jgi:2-oxoisovalerate dehydrogenase E2 component (dihydrolipoyl transacylase)